MVSIERCHSAEECATEELHVGPSSPVAITQGGSTEHQARVTFEGSFSEQMDPPALERTQYLLIPIRSCKGGQVNVETGIDLSRRCAKRMKEGQDRWLIVPRGIVDLSGASCDKVGTSFQAWWQHGKFNGGCSAPMGSCATVSPQSLYEHDENLLKKVKELTILQAMRVLQISDLWAISMVLVLQFIHRVGPRLSAQSR